MSTWQWAFLIVIVWVNVFGLLICALAARRDRRFSRFANNAIDLTGGQR